MFARVSQIADRGTCEAPKSSGTCLLLSGTVARSRGGRAAPLCSVGFPRPFLTRGRGRPTRDDVPQFTSIAIAI
jgi:hypothetical protein